MTSRPPSHDAFPEPSSARPPEDPPDAPLPAQLLPAQLLVRWSGGRSERMSFDEVHERLSPWVARWVQRAGVAKPHRSDVEQDAWRRIAQAWPTYRPELPIEPWLCTIVRHAAVDHLRRAHVRQEVPGIEVDAASGDPELYLQRRLDAQAFLAQALASLTDEEWAVFVLAEIEDMPCTDIAEALGMPLGTVHTRLRRARAWIEAMAARTEAAERRRTGRAGMLPAFLLAWVERWSRFWAWLRGRFTLGAVTGGAIVYWLLRPAAPPAPAPADLPASPMPRSAMTATVETPDATAAAEAAADVPAKPAPDATAARPERAVPGGQGLIPRPASAAVRAGGTASPGTSAPRSSSTGASPSSAGGGGAAGSGDAATWSDLAAIDVAHVLLGKGQCDEAAKRLAPRAERLARGPFAPEYQELQRKVRACPR